MSSSNDSKTNLSEKCIQRDKYRTIATGQLIKSVSELCNFIDYETRAN